MLYFSLCLLFSDHPLIVLQTLITFWKRMEQVKSLSSGAQEEKVSLGLAFQFFLVSAMLEYLDMRSWLMQRGRRAAFRGDRSF